MYYCIIGFYVYTGILDLPLQDYTATYNNSGIFVLV